MTKCRHTFITPISNNGNKVQFLCHDCNEKFDSLPGEEPLFNFEDAAGTIANFMEGMLTFREALTKTALSIEDFKKTCSIVNDKMKQEEKVEIHQTNGSSYYVTSSIKKRTSDPEEVDRHFQNLALTSQEFITGLIMSNDGWGMVETKFNDITHLESIEDQSHRTINITVSYLDDSKQLIKIGMF